VLGPFKSAASLLLERSVGIAKRVQPVQSENELTLKSATTTSFSRDG
jgi:hypothetical protein